MSPPPNALTLTGTMDGLADLAHRIHRGEVVFFVGAGFSTDSEGLRTERLMCRLLIRLHALDQLAAATNSNTPHHPAFQRLADTFSIAPTFAEIVIDNKWSDVRALGQRYYEVNAWMCRAYADLLSQISVASPEEFSTRLAAEDATGAELAARASWSLEKFSADTGPIWEEAHRVGKAGDATTGDSAQRDELGKLLFIQTLGFFDRTVMAGTPFPDAARTTPAALECSYAGRLRPRHHVLARFAREGFCPILLTTNFDLLLEGAYHLAGFRPEPSPATSPAPTSACREALRLATPWYDVIANPSAFFRRGKALQTVTILKIHGCAGYMHTLGMTRSRLDYLDQVIYTYREIQNWRDDSWAADYLRTLLRTRAFVFAGYSTADPVMHDTFRNVYEEMARKDRVDAQAQPPAAADLRVTTPAYFLAYSPKGRGHEFHGNEVLNSASCAVGAPPCRPSEEHPHYLRFVPASAQTEDALQLDELLLVTHHRIFRRQQQAALGHELPSLIARLHGKRRPTAEIESVIAAFTALVAAEEAPLPAPTSVNLARRMVHSRVTWSSGFHLALRREWARAQILERHPGDIARVADLDHPLWYFPASERPGWTAWSAVLELALRRLATLALDVWDPVTGAKTPKPAPLLPIALEASPAPHPTVLFPTTRSIAAPRVALTIKLRGFGPASQRPSVPGNPARQVVWRLREVDVPWRCAGDQSSSAASSYRFTRDQILTSPDARLIWQLALGTTRFAKPAMVIADLLGS